MIGIQKHAGKVRKSCFVFNFTRFFDMEQFNESYLQFSDNKFNKCKFFLSSKFTLKFDKVFFVQFEYQ